MSRQYGKLHMIVGDDTYVLQEERQAIDEGQIQDFIFRHPELLPIDEIEPFFQTLVPICRELGTPAGPADILFLNDKGLITLVECKLWRNPEARREVVAQILDYAKEINNWTYEDLQKAVYQSTGDSSRSLFEIVSDASEELDEGGFIDAVTRNLKRGRYLLLIVGDGIRQNVERIGEYLQDSAHLNFSLALVETKVFRCPEGFDCDYIFQPRILAQTIEIERAVFRIEDERIIAEPVVEEHVEPAGPRPRRSKISEQAFYDALDGNGKTSQELRKLIEEAYQTGLELELGQNSLKLKYHLEDKVFNFMVFYTYNNIRNFGIASATEDIGQPQLGLNYLERLAALLDSAYVRKGKAGSFHWTVRHRNGDYVTIPELLNAKDQWFTIVEDTIREINSTMGIQ